MPQNTATEPEAQNPTADPQQDPSPAIEASGSSEIVRPDELIAETKDGLAEQFCARYGISKSGFYARRNALGIDPVELPKEEGWMLTPEQVKLFDLLHQWVNAGKPMKTFKPPEDLMIEGELMEQARSRLRRAQELRAASLIAAYREAAQLTLEDLPSDLKEAVQEERVKFLAGRDEQETTDLETMVNDLLNGRL